MADAVREHHSHGESWPPPGMPEAVVFPTSTPRGECDGRPREHGASLDAMRAIKQALDPMNLMNPREIDSPVDQSVT